MKNLISLLICAILFSFCANKTAVNNGSTNSFGEKITTKGAISYDELYSKMKMAAGKDTLKVKVSGEVAAVCQVKGCWMNLQSKQAGVEPMMVRFKDYGFFMPKDIAGKNVVCEGIAYYDVTSVEELRHYAEDAGKSKAEIEAINSPKRELLFLANGVVLEK